MFYTIFIFIIGIFCGQEYKVIPSIKIITTKFITYLQNNTEIVEKFKNFLK